MILRTRSIRDEGVKKGVEGEDAMEQRRKKEGSSGSGNKGGGIARARDATYHLHKHIYIMYRIVYYT